MWIVAGDFIMEPVVFGQSATPTKLPGVLVTPAAPTSRHGASVRCFDNFVVHRTVACQILEARVLEESGISPHHPPPVMGCAREPRCWESEQETSMDER